MPLSAESLGRLPSPNTSPDISDVIKGITQYTLLHIALVGKSKCTEFLWGIMLKYKNR